MYKSTSRNMVSRAFRSSKQGTGKLRRIKLPKFVRRRLAKVGADKRRQKLQTEAALCGLLGEGPEFAWSIYERYRDQFSDLDNDPKRCSAYLNVVARERGLNGSLYNDEAIESILRRAADLKVRKKHSRKS